MSGAIPIGTHEGAISKLINRVSALAAELLCVEDENREVRTAAHVALEALDLAIAEMREAGIPATAPVLLSRDRLAALLRDAALAEEAGK